MSLVTVYARRLDVCQARNHFYIHVHIRYGKLTLHKANYAQVKQTTKSEVVITKLFRFIPLMPTGLVARFLHLSVFCFMYSVSLP